MLCHILPLTYQKQYIIIWHAYIQVQMVKTIGGRHDGTPTRNRSGGCTIHACRYLPSKLGGCADVCSESCALRFNKIMMVITKLAENSLAWKELVSTIGSLDMTQF